MNPRILGIIGGLALVLALLSPFMMGSSKKVEELYRSAEDLFSQADYEGAIAKYQEALEESTKRGVKTEVIDKDFPTLANFKIAVTYSRLAEQTGDVNHYETAIEFIEKVAPTATVPKHQEGLTYLWGHILYRTEQFDLAEAKFTQLIENFPNSIQVENAWYAIGQLNYKLKNYEASRNAFKEVLDGYPNSDFKDDAQHLIAQSFLNENDYTQAYQEFDKINTEEFKNYPELQAEAMYKAAYCINQLGDREDEAIERYTNFITQFPESQYVTAAYFDLGSIYSRLGDYDNARINYELALQNTSDRALQAEIQSNIGRTYYDQKDYENAIVSYNTLLSDYPDSDFVADAKVGIADSQFQLSQWNEAAAAYERVINEHADITDYVPYSSYQIGEAYYKLGTDQKDAGETDAATTSLELALQWYQKTIDEFPEDSVAPHALYGAIWTLNDLGRKEELERVAHEFINKNKNDNELDILAAEVQLRFADIKRTEFKQYIEAAEEYAKLWEYRPLPKFHLIKLMGKFFEGRSYYEAAKPEEYQEGDDGTNFNMDYLQQSVQAYQAAIEMFSDDAFLPGIEEGRYQDFDERIAQVEACLMNEALSHEMLGAWDAARARYAMIPDHSAYYERALLLTANSYVTQGNKAEAITYYNTILPNLKSDNRSLAEIKLADLLRAEKRFLEAATQYEAVVEGNPTGEYADDALYLIGLCYYHASSEDPALLEKSEAAFKQMLEKYADSPNLIEAYYGLVLVYRDAAQKHGDTAKWGLVLQTADEASTKYINSDDDLVLRTLGHIDLIRATAIENTNADDIDSVVQSLQAIFNNTRSPEEARVRSLLKIGHTYYSKQRYQEALASYLLFVESFPDNEIAVNAQYQAAVCYYQIAQKSEEDGDAESAQLAFQSAVSAAEKISLMTESPDDRIRAGYTLGLAKLGLKDNKGAIEAFKGVTALEFQTEDVDRKKLVFQSHSRLAELQGEVGDYTASVKAYQKIIENTEDADLKGRSYFAIALTQDEHLKTYLEAAGNYQNAIQFLENAIVKAQSYYRLGLLYQDKLNQLDKALETFQTLIANYSTEPNSNIASMVADAGIRRSDLYVKLGRLDDAIAEAVEAVKTANANPNATVARKVAAQYNLGYLYSDKARSLFSNIEGTELQPYIDASNQAASAFFEVSKLAAPVENADKKTVIPYVQNALYQSGQIYYSVGASAKRREELLRSLQPLTEFVKYSDQGVFPATSDLSKNLETALTYLASANFDLGRMQAGIDEEMSPQAITYFDAAVKFFNDLVKRFPQAKDAALWQYQAGESYFATEQYQKAIVEYGKVRRVNKTHEKAPESLYAIASCYQLLTESAAAVENAAKQQEYYDKLLETNEMLVAEYPNSPLIAEALINIGNKYYNAALDESLEKPDQIALYQKAIENYRRALNTPGISDESKGTAQAYLNETATVLANNEYTHASGVLDKAKLSRAENREPILREAITKFQAIVTEYPGTKYGDLSYVQIAEAYLVIADKGDERYYADAWYYFKKLPEKYREVIPNDPQIDKAITYSLSKAQQILAYMKSKEISTQRVDADDSE